MKDISKEKSIELVNIINKMQRVEFKFKKEKGREPNNDELSMLLNEHIERIVEIKNLLTELDNEYEKLKCEQKSHTKDDIKKAREIRKSKKGIGSIQKYMKDL